MEDQLRLDDNQALVTLKRSWEKALDLLADEINPPSFEGWVRTAVPLSLNGDTAVFAVKSAMAKIFLEKYSDLIKTALSSTLGREVDLGFTVLEDKKQSKSKSTKVKAERKTGTVSSFSMPLNDKYTLSSFVVGPCNRLAHAAAKSLADDPGRVYNPFFLYGGPGLGKTHLLQAIGHHIIKNHPDKQVAYISGELFTTQYVTAIREHRSEDFRRKYRSVDVWLFDDVQFLAGKERTKEEFFHTFNTLHQMNKQIVLTSDRSPRDLAPVEERLKSRFESGLVADLAPPDLETRIAILESKALDDGAVIPFPLLECIANLIPTNIRAMEGALITLLAYSSLTKTPLTIALAEEVLGRYIDEKTYAELSPEAIQRAVAQAFSIEVEDLTGSKRTKELALARHIAMYLTRELTAYPLQAIGRAFGKNHASVIHAHSRVQSLIDSDEELKRRVQELAEELRAGRF